MSSTALLIRPMARKNPGDRQPHASALRREQQSAKDFRDAARLLTEQAAALDELAELVESEGFRRITVDGVRKFPNAMTLVRAYVGNVKKAVIDEQNR